METFTIPKSFIENPEFKNQRTYCLKNLDYTSIDDPIVSMIRAFNKIEYCYTLQCCYGHFVYNAQKDIHNLVPLPDTYIHGEIEYRIAYIALCIENNSKGHRLCKGLKNIPTIDNNNIQFGCAEWFWQRQVNSYALQVEPERFKNQDKAFIDYNEARHLEKIRNQFFKSLHQLISDLV